MEISPTISHKPNELLHFVLVPLMSPGHLLPMVDIARLLAWRDNVKVTIMTSTRNADRVRANLEREIKSGSSISVQHFRFPNVENGLPEDCEGVESLPSNDLLVNFGTALYMCHEPVEELFKKLDPSPTCVIHDKHVFFVADIAKKLRFLRITFEVTNCFYILCDHVMYESKVYENVEETEPVVVPGLPDKIVFKQSQLPELFELNKDGLKNVNIFREITKKGNEESFGLVLNTFEELEEAYVEEYRRVTCRNVWCIGPVSLSNNDDVDKAKRGRSDSKEKDEEAGKYLKWLDSRPAGSVIYVCLGSLNCVPPEQLMEVGLGLEATKRPFIWVLRDSLKKDEMDKLLKEDGLEERVKERGLIIRGWAPQIMILSHKAIGAFLSHCGWNSTLEGICRGVPIITFPTFSDQFYNEKLLVEVMKMGVSVGIDNALFFGEEDKFGVQVKREKVKEAIEKVMGEEDEESEKIRERAKEYGEKAKKAIEKGGSSYNNLTKLIDGVIEKVKCKVENGNKA